MPKLVKDKNFVVEPNNPRALAEKILLVLGDDELVKKNFQRIHGIWQRNILGIRLWIRRWGCIGVMNGEGMNENI